MWEKILSRQIILLSFAHMVSDFQKLTDSKHKLVLIIWGYVFQWVYIDQVLE